ncbi:exodeoxyribonuclease V subunit gamma [Winogradskya consettensis]|uniref:RecBCD enzyme subunit RecC n=1 Tax=Winogradskya consettensis TaxID=113560 RepID=A0A919SS61_9ACTN|nr:exodeoxyribonuclease V subunit gamma [Actinoplanes consettensis]GIM77542.1 RecBCD enzyme subunit RecC [Actinoplanes consettensis]
MLRLHRAERADHLAEALAALLRTPLPDPFAPEIISVPSRGVERWLAQRLSHHLGTTPPNATPPNATPPGASPPRADPPGAGSATGPAAGPATVGHGDGICANVQFLSVSALIDSITDPGGPAALGAAPDPWHPDRLVWHVLDAIDRSVQQPWCSTLAAYLATDGRRYATARHLAALFDSYNLHRPDMVTAWTAGDDVDGIGRTLPEDLRWQAALWRDLRARLHTPGPAERLTDLCETLRHDPQAASMPPRLSVFGLTRLPSAHAALLTALAEHHDVHLWLPHPSPVLWDRLRAYSKPRTRLDDPTKDLPRNPLLASLGRDARELQLSLTTPSPPHDTHHPGPAYPDTTLGRLQHAIANDLPPEQSPAPQGPATQGPADSSVQVHACHGPDRQVEVLREVILGLLSRSPGLEPRDILVMCPDIETFAPLISASFGLGEQATHPAHRLRVRLADRALRQVNPLFAVVGRLLELAGSRVTAAQVLDFASLPPVRREFRLDDDDLDRMRDLVVESGVRWGFDAGHRARFQLDVRPNTWAAGLDRILLGVAMSEEELTWLGTALPLDDVDSSDVDLAGRLAELVDRLETVLTAMISERPLNEWREVLAGAVDSLTDVPDADAWQSSQVRAELFALTENAQNPSLGLGDISSLLSERLRGRPTRANFRTGDLTMCTMVPMRSVPHRVVCVLGLDDGAFPRQAGVDGDDVLARDPCVGERDPRGEDRQLLLDAVMAATGTLVMLYSGADERTNAPRPPCVPLDELLDVLGPDVVTHHPLQPFDQRNFTGDPFSFDPTALAGALAAAGERRAPTPFLTGPLPPNGPSETVALDDLRAFLDHPVRAFLRRNLGLGFSTGEDEPDDALPVELDALSKWAVGDRMLRALLDGADLERCVQAEWRRGAVPPGPLGKRLLDEIAADVRPLSEAARAHLTGTPEALDVELPLPGGRRLTGTVANVHDDTVVTITYAKLGPKYRIRAWLNLLALSATRPGIPWRAVTIGRGMRGGASRSTLGPIDADKALRTLTTLIAWAEQGEPALMATRTSHAYAQSRLAGRPPEVAVNKAWDAWTRFGGGGESDDPAHTLVWGPGAPLDRLTATASSGPEPTLFGGLALQLWRPLHDAEVLDVP